MDAVMALGWQAWFTLCVVGGITLILARERLGPDIAMFSGLSALVVFGVLSPVDALEGFSNPAIATIGLMFVVAAAVQETGGIAMISGYVFGQTRSATAALLRLLIPTAFMSAFVNNTPIVAISIPMARSYAGRLGVPHSQFLLPLAYASMMGGTWTLIGTSPNLIISGALEKEGLTPFGMLELGWIGVPTTIVGIIYLTTLGKRLIPDRTSLKDAAAAEAKEYLAELELAKDSPLVGQTVQEAGLRNLPGLFLAEIRRVDDVIRPVAPQSTLQAGDHLVFTGISATVQDLMKQFPGLHPVDDVRIGGRGLFEVVISHRSDLVGRTVKDVGFRRRFGAAILAVHRAGERVGDKKIGEIILQTGDTLMLSASPGFQETFRNSPDFYLVSQVDAAGATPPRYQRAPIALATVVGMVVVKTAAGPALPMVVCAMGAMVVLIGTRCISARSVRASVNWTVLVLIGSALGVATAMDQTGAANAVAQLLVQATAPLGVLGTLAGIYLFSAVFASFISNAAAAALAFPIAIEASQSVGMDPRVAAIAVALAASAGFATPIGSNPNLLVYGPGGYRYSDFTRVGLPMNLLALIVLLILLPLLWTLEA